MFFLLFIYFKTNMVFLHRTKNERFYKINLPPKKWQKYFVHKKWTIISKFSFFWPYVADPIQYQAMIIPNIQYK